MSVSYMFLDWQPQLDFSLTSVLDDVAMYNIIAKTTIPTIVVCFIYIYTRNFYTSM